MELHSAKKRAPLGFTMPRKDGDLADVIDPGARLIVGAGHVIDLEKATSTRVPAGERAIVADGPHLLFKRGNDAVWRDVDTGEERRFPAPEEGRIPAMRGGSMILWRGLVIDVSAGKVLGRTEGTPLALGRDGRLLYDPGQIRTSQALPHGPLWWAPPMP